MFEFSRTNKKSFRKSPHESLLSKHARTAIRIRDSTCTILQQLSCDDQVLYSSFFSSPPCLVVVARTCSVSQSKYQKKKNCLTKRVAQKMGSFTPAQKLPHPNVLCVPTHPLRQHTHRGGRHHPANLSVLCVCSHTWGERKHCSPVTLFPRPCVCREGCAAERSQRARLHSLLGVCRLDSAMKLPSPPSWHRPPLQRGWSQGLQRRCLAWARWRRAHPRASPASTPTCLRRRRGRFFPTNTPTPLTVFRKAM
jgi:hypothetical protein